MLAGKSKLVEAFIEFCHEIKKKPEQVNICSKLDQQRWICFSVFIVELEQVTVITQVLFTF